MSRSEFGKPVRREALKRAADQCEGILASGHRCPTVLSKARKYHFDHVVADGLGGKPELSNCAVLCVPCHDEKTKRDVELIARAKRRQDARLQITAPKQTIKSAPFAKSAPARRATAPLSKTLPPRRRPLYAQGAN